jgi:glutamate-1-semialdehyde 2,1-aminomutase
MLGASGLIPPKSGYLKGMRELAKQHGLVLIFDEVMTFRLSTGGMQAIYGVEPDLTALGKIIGGGFAIGAFGGKRQIMEQFDPGRSGRLFHSGTFNGNNITMAAGLKAMELYDQKGVDRVNELGNRLREGFRKAFEKVGIKGQATGVGSLVGVHWREGEMKNARDTAMGVESAAELPGLLHLEMMNQGIFSASRGMYVVSTPMTEREIDRVVKAFESTLNLLRPYVAETTPYLLSG